MLMRQERNAPTKASAAGVRGTRTDRKAPAFRVGQLSPRQRPDLIESLWESLDDEDVPATDAQRAERDQRIASFDQDRGTHHSVEPA
jgi:putative addiction module component (TIGR02574 family)